MRRVRRCDLRRVGHLQHDPSRSRDPLRRLCPSCCVDPRGATHGHAAGHAMHRHAQPDRPVGASSGQCRYRGLARAAGGDGQGSLARRRVRRRPRHRAGAGQRRFVCRAGAAVDRQPWLTAHQNRAGSRKSVRDGLRGRGPRDRRASSGFTCRPYRHGPCQGSACRRQLCRGRRRGCRLQAFCAQPARYRFQWAARDPWAERSRGADRCRVSAPRGPEETAA